MAVPHDREIGNGVKLEKVRAHDNKKVAGHKVSSPGRLEEGKAVKDVEGLPTFDCSDVEDLGSERFKSGVGIKQIDLDMFRRLEQSVVVGEPHIDNPSLFLDGILDKGKNEVAVVFYLINLPDDVIAKAQSVQYFIKAWKTSACGKR
jgi:hypothetical protein